MAERLPQRHLVLILARNFASRLATPFWLVDSEGTVILFNEAAEDLLGRRFVEGRGAPASEWSTTFRPRDAAGNVMPYEALPTSVAIREGRPSHADVIYIRDADGMDHPIGVTAFPLFAHPDECLGAIAIFWEQPPAETV
jgi:PAS domain-containing protein